MNENHGVLLQPPNVEQRVLFCATTAYRASGFQDVLEVNALLQKGWTVHSVTPLPLLGDTGSTRVGAAVFVLQRDKNNILPQQGSAIDEVLG